MKNDAESPYRQLASPINIGAHTARNRVFFAPTSVGYAVDGVMSPASVEHYARRAAGGVGAVMTEQVAVSESGWQHRNQPGAWAPRHKPGLAEVAAGIHRYGALAIAQLSHTGRYAGPWERYAERRRIAPSAIEFDLPGVGTVTPQEITTDEIARTVSEFARATELVLECGFDGIEIHGSSGFLLSAFLSPRMNCRTDRYGGDSVARQTFPIEVMSACRAAAGTSAVVGYHLMTDELMPGGFTRDDALALVGRLCSAGADLIRPAAGTFEAFRAPQNSGRSSGVGYEMPDTRAVSAVSSVPVLAGGGIRNPEQAEAILAAGDADLIALSRPLLADPDWYSLVASGRQPLGCACVSATCLRTQLRGTICDAWPESVRASGFSGFAHHTTPDDRVRQTV